MLHLKQRTDVLNISLRSLIQCEYIPKTRYSSKIYFTPHNIILKALTYVQRYYNYLVIHLVVQLHVLTYICYALICRLIIIIIYESSIHIQTLRLKDNSATSKQKYYFNFVFIVHLLENPSIKTNLPINMFLFLFSNAVQTNKHLITTVFWHTVRTPSESYGQGL